MGSSSGGKKKHVTFRSRQRANLSFFIVVMFFGVFGVIVFTEIFFIDERNNANGVFVRHGGQPGGGGAPGGINGIGGYQRKDRGQEYDDGFQNEDYISIRVGAAMLNDETLGAILLGGGVAPMRRHSPVALPLFLHNSPPISSKVLSETQLPPFPDNSTISEGAWQTVNNTRYKFFVFSAFLDQRKGLRNVRVVGATKTRGPEPVWCRLWHKISDYNTSVHLSVTVPAKIKVIRENWNLKYSACFIMCPLTNKTVPAAVSIVANPRDPPTNLVTVINNYNETGGTNIPAQKFGVCVKPLHFDYNREMQILEFLELNRLLGVEHFVFYNHTIGPQVNCILRHYIETGLVTVLPWHLDMVSQKEIRTEGLFAALNDCLYRYMFKYSHVLLIDLDEFILPKYNDTLPQLIDYLTHRLNTRTTASFSFQNAFFYLQWDDDPAVYEMEDSITANLVTLKKTRRRSKLHPHKQRSKYICRPEWTVEAGNHFVWEFIPGHGTLNVPADAAILHHYRICEFGGDDCIKTASVVDKTAYRYKEILTDAVRFQHDKLRLKCNLSELKLPRARVFDKLMNLLNGGSE